MGPDGGRRPAAHGGMERAARPRHRQPAKPAAMADQRRLWRGIAAGRIASPRPPGRAATGAQPAVAGWHAEVGTRGYPAGPDGPSMGGARRDREADRSGRARSDRGKPDGRVYAAGTPVPESRITGADGDPAGTQPAS